MSAARQAIHACQRSSGKVAPSDAGGIGGVTVRPLDPPRKPENFVASRVQYSF